MPEQKAASPPKQKSAVESLQDWLKRCPWSSFFVDPNTQARQNLQLRQQSNERKKVE